MKILQIEIRFLQIKKNTNKRVLSLRFNQACTGWMWMWYIFILSKIITFGGTFIDSFTLYKALTYFYKCIQTYFWSFNNNFYINHEMNQYLI